MKTRKPRTYRTPRNALAFINAEVWAALKDTPARSHAELVTALIRIERLALEALYPDESVTPSETQP